MPDPTDHGALIAAAFERFAAQQRDIDSLGGDVGRVEGSLSDRIGKLENAVNNLATEIREMRIEHAKREGADRMLKRIGGVVLMVAGVVATFFSGVFTGAHH